MKNFCQACKRFGVLNPLRLCVRCAHRLNLARLSQNMTAAHKARNAKRAATAALDSVKSNESK